jgi:hypothetical protein
MISPNIIIPFDGLNANIPTGWSRETSLDGRYPKGWTGLAVGATGGSNTHSHSSPAHSHTLAHHTHTITTSFETTGTWSGDDAGSGSGAGGNHDHSSNSNSSTSGGTLSTAITYASTNSEPPYYEVIFIKSDSYNFIPENGLVLSTSTSREGMASHEASAGRYLKGASTGADAGASSGSITHTHSVTHTHSAVTHSHSGTTNTAGTDNYYAGSGDQVAAGKHNHAYSVPNESLAGNQYAGTVTSPTVEPVYRTLNCFYSSSGSTLPTVGDIALWMGSATSAPIGWQLCNGSGGTPDMTNRFLKVPTLPETSSIGGANTHSHATSNSHSHSTTSHTHSSGQTSNNTSQSMTGVGAHSAIYRHRHTITTGSGTASWSSSSIAANSSDNQPAYTTVAYIQMKFQSAGSAPLISIM